MPDYAASHLDLFSLSTPPCFFSTPFGAAGGGCRGTTAQLLAATLCLTHRFVQDPPPLHALLLGEAALLHMLLLC